MKDARLFWDLRRLRWVPDAALIMVGRGQVKTRWNGGVGI